ncbi:MauE/DoxX family redox-associated membrane protein [Streptomyces erythrochromogenes]|uniref:MauE/DoxX family redox-associated membrane protein n=1 Tax=Streptomyces erythrochromogenes TaxID=285574 RepID=UPI003325E795
MTSALVFGQTALAAVFLISALPKVRRFAAFRSHVRATVPVLTGKPGVVAIGAVAAELLTAAALLYPGSAGWGSAMALVMLITFTAYLARLIAGGSSAACGCAGSGGQAASWRHLLRNAILLVLAAVLLIVLAAGGSGAPQVIQYVVLAAPAAATGAVLLYLPEVLLFFRSPLSPRS